jgi:hypothetical protein
VAAENDDLGYIAYSQAANTVRYGVIGGQTNSPGRAVGLPGGARPMNAASDRRGEYFLAGDGTIWGFVAGSLKQTAAKAPPGHPIELVYYDDGVLFVAENKDGYQVLRQGTQVYKSPAGHQPIWLGRCGESDHCVVDEYPSSPAGRQLFRLGQGVTPLGTAVPYAAPVDPLPGTGNHVVVPTLEGDKAGSVVANPGSSSYTSYYGDVRLVGGPLRSGEIDALLLPTRPAGAPETWSATSQDVDISGVQFANGRQTDMGTITVIPASCSVAASRLGCATLTDFRVWKVDRG